jgi:hypothetical protein
MQIGNGNRKEWTFDYTAKALADGARQQLSFRLGRVEWWKDAKAKVMAEIKDTGIEVSESVAADLSNYTKAMHGPQVMVRADLQSKITECHNKIMSHQQAADEYDGWIQLLDANPEARVPLTADDWLYFFGKTP